jgi:Flp pilus assembly protein TadD
MLAVLLLGTGGARASREVRESAYRDNNHGVALLEQFRPQDAASAFRKALSLDPDLALARINLAIALVNVPDLPAAEREARAAIATRPDSPQAHYVLGLAARGQNNPADAFAAFRKVLQFDPTDVGSNVNLGQLYLQDRKYEDAIAAFRAALATESFSATAAYNLGIALSRSGQAEAGQKAMERFQALREAGYGTLIGQTYPEQGRYAEALASTGAEGDLVDAATPAVRFVDATASALPTTARTPGVGRVTLFDLDGDSDLDLFDVGAAGQRLYHNDGGRFVDATASLGLDPSQGGIGAVAGDLDNDERADLLVLRKQGVTLYRNDAAKGLVEVTTRAGLASAGSAETAALADFDHDGDLDILLAGSGGPDRLLQNAGDASFKDVASAAGLAATARVLAAIATDYDNGRDIDLLEIVEGAAPRLFRNLRDGSFRDVAQDVGLGRAQKLRSLAAADVNKDAYSDFFLGSDTGDLLALSTGRGGFTLMPVPWGSSGTTSAQFLDYDDDGLLDLVAFASTQARILRNLGDRWRDESDEALGAARRVAASGFASGDLDGDGDTDVLVRLLSGELRLWRNDGGNRNHSLRVRLTGLVSNRSGIGAKLELRAGSLSQKLETSATTPSAAPADVLFGLGPREAVDAVRVIWPAGVLQTELDPAVPAAETKTAAAFEIKELNRKPSSCPYLYAWNGSAFAFITDFMGGGEMGYYEAPGVWNEPDPIEYVRLTDDQLRARDGRYELRVTNELEEALFVDRIALVSLAHPADVEIYPYEGMTSPPKPVRFFAVKNARPPTGAQDDHGRDVLERLLRMDRRSPDDFRLFKVRGYAADHTLTLDLGATTERAVLLLTGWTDYAWSSDNVAAQQAGLAMRPPSLEVQDATGSWVSAVEQVGVPVGRPQTVVVDLAGAFKGRSRQVRIVTNMRIYWDRIQVADGLELPGESVMLDASEARLTERGFSAEVTPDGREPFGYDYGRVSQASPWKAFPGRYTREGDVRELLLASDDVFMTSRPGDEIALAFDARRLPELPDGWKRSFLLFSDGFSKEMDIHSATPDAIGPLPFHGMSRYPYTAPESYPMTEARARLMERYNTRVVKAPVVSLDAALLAEAR